MQGDLGGHMEGHMEGGLGGHMEHVGHTSEHMWGTCGATGTLRCGLCTEVWSTH